MANPKKKPAQNFRINTLDVRSIGLFRIILGLNIIYNIFHYRLFSITTFYGSESIVPESLLKQNYGDLFSLLYFLDADWHVVLYFVITIILAIAYTAGLKSKWVSLPLLIMFASITNRNPVLAHGVEFMMEVALFWGIFLPLDASFSIWPSHKKYPKAEYSGFFTFGILFQIAIIYFTSVITKTGEFWKTGNTVLSITEDYTHSILVAPYLAELPGLCTFLSYFTLLLELLIPILIFLPIFNKKARLVAALLIVMIHWGLAGVIYVGPFHLVTLSYAAILIPDFVWEKFKIPGDTHFRLPFIQMSLKKTAKNSQTGPFRTYGLYILKAIVIIMLCHVLLENMKKWKKDSYLSPVIHKITPLSRLAEITPVKSTMITGLFRQPWWLFAPDPVKDMGTIGIFGRTENNETLNLLSEEILKLSQDPITNEPVFDKPPYNGFTGSRFVLSFYARRYLTQWPPEIFARWTEYEYEQWRKKNPNYKLLQVNMMYYSNETSLVRGQLKRKKNLIQLYSKVIE